MLPKLSRVWCGGYGRCLARSPHICPVELLYWFGMKWFLFGLIALVLAALFAVGSYIAPQDELKPANAIIAVSGGDTKARTQEAVKLYQEDWAPLLIFSGAASDPESISNAQAMKEIAVDQGVPPDVVAIEEFSRNTQENAGEVGTIIDALRHKTVILVTSPYHQRRTYLEFQERLGGDVEIINHSAPDKNWSRQDWWTNANGWYLTLTEVPKTLIAQLVTSLPY